MLEQIEKGTPVRVRSDFAPERAWIAHGPVTMGGDFEVVVVVPPEEWDSAEAEGREPTGYPWPAEDVIPA